MPMVSDNNTTKLKYLNEIHFKKILLMISPLEPDQPSEKVVDAKHRFAKKRFSDRYLWTPNPELEASILKAAWNNYH